MDFRISNCFLACALVVVLLAFPAVASAEVPQCVEPATGLIGWWPAEGSMSDVVGGNDGTAGFTVVYSAGQVGQAFDLDGSEVIEVPHAPELSPQSITIETWFLADAIDGFRRIVNQDSYDLFIGPDGLLRCIVDTQAYVGLEIAAGATSLSAGTWHHIACTWDSATSVGQVYLDGAPVGLGTDMTDGDPLVASSGPLRLGGWSGQNIDGRLDEVSIYDRALTGAEIAAIHAAGSGGKCLDEIFADGFESGTTAAWSGSVQ